MAYNNTSTFGNIILTKYCGTSITDPFYTPSVQLDGMDIGMLMTEYQIGYRTFKLLFENMLFVVLSIFMTFITQMSVFCVAKTICKWKKTTNPCNPLKKILFVTSIILTLTVTITAWAHLMTDIGKYYTFVDDVVGDGPYGTSCDSVGKLYGRRWKRCGFDGFAKREYGECGENWILMDIPFIMWYVINIAVIIPLILGVIIAMSAIGIILIVALLLCYCLCIRKIQSQSKSDDDNETDVFDDVELKVRSRYKMDQRQENTKEVIQKALDLKDINMHQDIKTWSQYVHIGNICISLSAPLFIIILLGITQISITLMLFYFNGSEWDWFGTWHWYQPFFTGFYDSFVDTFESFEHFEQYLSHILSSTFSWKELFNLLSAFDEIKFTILFLKACAHFLFRLSI